VRGAAATLSDVVDSASGVVPDSVPRPAAKVLVGALGVTVVVGVFKSILSTVLLTALLAGGGWRGRITSSL